MQGTTMIDTTKGHGPPREPTEAMINAIHSTHQPGWHVSWYTVWTTMYDAWDRERARERARERDRDAFLKSKGA